MTKYTPLRTTLLSRYQSSRMIENKSLLNLVIIFIAFVTLFISTNVFALPVLNGPPSGVSVGQRGNSMIINQSTRNAVIKWKSFNINRNESTHFQQPKGGLAINRIDGVNGVSRIFGTLTATGRIVLINPAGIFFGRSARVDVGGLIATTSDMSNFKDPSRLVFDIPSKYPNASIINKGTIRAADYGLVALVGNNVQNDGNIQARGGQVILASGNKFTFDFVGDRLVNFAIDGGTAQTSSLDDMGSIRVTPQAAQKILDHSVNTKGIAEAKSVTKAANGDIFFGDGSVRVAGKIDVSSRAPGQKGGSVKILAKNVYVDKVKIDASGDAGGGEVLIGGNARGAGPEMNAKNTYVGKDALIDASAVTKGHGGKVVVWSDNTTQFDGQILARGGAVEGNGGWVETSGKYLDVGTNASVNTLAANGVAGSWLLDPTNIVISNAASGPNMTGSSPFRNTGGDAASVLNITTLQNALHNGNVIVDANFGGGPSVGSITVSTSITWSSPYSLTLQSGPTGNVSINSPITANGDLIIHAKSTNINQNIAVRDLTISGAVNTLINLSIQASRNIAFTGGPDAGVTLPSRLVAGGNITVTAESIAIDAGLTAGGSIALQQTTPAMMTVGNSIIAGGNVSFSGGGTMTLDGSVNAPSASFNLPLTVGTGTHVLAGNMSFNSTVDGTDGTSFLDIRGNSVFRSSVGAGTATGIGITGTMTLFSPVLSVNGAIMGGSANSFIDLSNIASAQSILYQGDGSAGFGGNGFFFGSVAFNSIGGFNVNPQFNNTMNLAYKASGNQLTIDSVNKAANSVGGFVNDPLNFFGFNIINGNPNDVVTFIGNFNAVFQNGVWYIGGIPITFNNISIFNNFASELATSSQAIIQATSGAQQKDAEDSGETTLDPRMLTQKAESLQQSSAIIKGYASAKDANYCSR